MKKSVTNSSNLKTQINHKSQILIMKKAHLIFLFLSGIIYFSSCTTRKVNIESLLNEMVQRELVPEYPDPYYKTGQFSSYDRATISPDSAGWFANWDRSMFLYIEENGNRKEYVMMDTDGPGTITRFWMTFAGKSDGKGILRIYLDGAEEPVIVGTAFDVLSGNIVSNPPLASSVSEITRYERRGHNLYFPIPYQSHCKITYESDQIKDAGATSGGEKVYYNINYRTYPKRTSVKSFTMEQLHKLKPLVQNVNDKLQKIFQTSVISNIKPLSFSGLLSPGQQLKQTIKGSGAIRKLSLKISAADINQALRSTVLEIRFDDNRTVWCPLGDFFGTGYQIRPHQSWYTSVQKDSLLQAFWVMPFRDNAVYILHNYGSQDIDISQGEIIQAPYKWSSRTMYFGCSWKNYPQLNTGKPNKTFSGENNPDDINYTILKGKGKYVGDNTVLFNTAYNWWGEGDEKIYIDGESFPSHIGTGTEDYYGYAWCRPEKFTNHPFIAQPDGSGNFVPGYTVNIRYRALDDIPFSTQLRMDMENWHWRNTLMSRSVTSYFYLNPKASCKINIDSLGVQLAVVTDRSDLYSPILTNGVIEAENMKVLSQIEGRFSYQFNLPELKFSNNKQIFWRSKKANQTLELGFIVPESGVYNVNIVLTNASDYGSFSLRLNDQLVKKSLSLNQSTLTLVKYNLGKLNLPQSLNTLSIESLEPAPKGDKYYFGMDALSLEKQ